MDKDIELIKKVDSVLSTAYNIVDIEHREIFLKEKLSVFDDFYEKIYSILGKYQYKEKNNEEQNQIADIVKNAEIANTGRSTITIIQNPIFL